MSMVPWIDQMEDALDKAGSAGMVRNAIISALGLPDVRTFHEVKGLLQDRMADKDRTVVGDSSTAMAGGWTYSLQSDPTHAVSKRYNMQKVQALFGRQTRAYKVAASLARGIPANTSAGRAARRLARSYYRTLEDTVDIFAELGMKMPAMPAKL